MYQAAALSDREVAKKHLVDANPRNSTWRRESHRALRIMILEGYVYRTKRAHYQINDGGRREWLNMN